MDGNAERLLLAELQWNNTSALWEKVSRQFLQIQTLIGVEDRRAFFTILKDSIGYVERAICMGEVAVDTGILELLSQDIASRQAHEPPAPPKPYGEASTDPPPPHLKNRDDDIKG